MGVKDNIEHIDTNIVIRLIVGDNPKNYEKAKKLISQKDKLFVFEDAAIIEVVFVLSKIYKYSRKEIAATISCLSDIDNIIFNKGIIEDTMNLFVSHPKLSFVDCYLATVTEISQETPLWTFDHKLAAQCRAAREP